MKLSLIVLSFSILINSAFAKDLAFVAKDFEVSNSVEHELKASKEYLTISNVEVKEVKISKEELETLHYEYLYTQEKADKSIGSVIMVVNKLLALGTKIWDIVKKGKPVVTTRFATPISVLPKSKDPNTTFYDMENWSAPSFKRYRVEFKNLFGMTVIGFTYNVQFQHSGTYEGKGKYITGLTVSASDLAVSWGFEFNAESQLIAISNRGRRDDPLSAATIEIKYRASSVLREINSTETFHVTGNGNYTKY